MISLTKIDKSTVLLNLETIKYVEFVPDTLITFLNGDTVMVKETLEEINKLVLNFKRKIFQHTG